MYQGYKFLALALVCIPSTMVWSFLFCFSDQANVVGVAIFGWAVGAALSVTGVLGYADSRTLFRAGRASGLYLDSIGKHCKVKRGYAGWEFDSHYSRRIVREATKHESNV